MRKSLLIVVDEGPAGFPADQATEELESLCRTAGIDIGKTLFLKVREPVSATYFGKGKVSEITDRLKENGLGYTVLNLDLSATQHRNLERLWEVEILDRTGLILQIFSRHAHSAAGKLQVELARQNYLLSRLTGRGILLSRLGGGIGTRGPGEMKLEEERRRIREQIRRANERLTALEEQRQRTRELRQRKGFPEITLVGYTNVGKSALLNALCRKSSALVADKLFATLDTTSRRLYLGENRYAVVTDTVGFVHNLPHMLVAAFHATLEGVGSSQLVLLVLDASTPLVEEHLRTTGQVLNEISAKDVPALLVLNKSDLINAEQQERIKRKFPEGLLVSSLTGEGISDLKTAIARRLWTN